MNAMYESNNNKYAGEELKISVVHKHLDKKIKLAGFELVDVLSVLFLSSVMNLIFGRTGLAFVMVFMVPLTVGIVLHLGKKNKPENFILHFIRYYLTPGYYAAGAKLKSFIFVRGKIYDGK